MPATPTKSVSLTVRLAPDEVAQIDDACAYLEAKTTNVLGAHHFSRAEALKKLLAVGYKKFLSARRLEARGRANDDSERDPDNPLGDRDPTDPPARTGPQAKYSG